MDDTDRNTLINMIDFQFVDIFRIGSDYELFHASNEKMGKEILLQCIHDCDKEEQLFINNRIQEYIYDHESIVKIIGVSLPLVEDEKMNNKCFKINLSNQLIEKLYDSPTTIIIVYEYFKFYNLSILMNDYIKSKGTNNEKMNPTIRSKIIFGVAAIMKHVHKKCYSYGQLQYEKIVLDEKYEPKLFNFQIRDDIESLKFSIYNDRLYSIKYFAPELYNCLELPDKASDVFAFAIFLYQMFSERITFENKNYLSQSAYNIEINKGNRPKRPDNIPNDYWELIQLCWKQDPKDRPSFDEIVSILKNDKFAIEEFGMKTDINQLHEYQKIMDPEKLMPIKYNNESIIPFKSTGNNFNLNNKNSIECIKERYTSNIIMPKNNSITRNLMNGFNNSTNNIIKFESEPENSNKDDSHKDETNNNSCNIF